MTTLEFLCYGVNQGKIAWKFISSHFLEGRILFLLILFSSLLALQRKIVFIDISMSFRGLVDYLEIIVKICTNFLPRENFKVRLADNTL